MAWRRKLICLEALIACAIGLASGLINSDEDGANHLLRREVIDETVARVLETVRPNATVTKKKVQVDATSNKTESKVESEVDKADANKAPQNNQSETKKEIKQASLSASSATVSTQDDALHRASAGGDWLGRKLYGRYTALENQVSHVEDQGVAVLIPGLGTEDRAAQVAKNIGWLKTQGVPFECWIFIYPTQLWLPSNPSRFDPCHLVRHQGFWMSHVLAMPLNMTAKPWVLHMLDGIEPQPNLNLSMMLKTARANKLGHTAPTFDDRVRRRQSHWPIMSSQNSFAIGRRVDYIELQFDVFSRGYFACLQDNIDKDDTLGWGVDLLLPALCGGAKNGAISAVDLGHLGLMDHMSMLKAFEGSYSKRSAQIEERGYINKHPHVPRPLFTTLGKLQAPSPTIVTETPEIAHLGAAKALRVRYGGVALDVQYIEKTLLPQLTSSMFLVEKFLAPSLAVKYTIYTSSLSDEPLKNMLNKVFPDIMPRISFLNLDEDPNDKIRMAAYKGLHLNDMNLASVRRMLADVHLPSTEGRLFLDTDISFLKRPDDFVEKIQQHEVVYMIDQLTFHGQAYKVTAYDGPQCEGLLAALVYVAAGIQIPEEEAHHALKFYADLPHHPPRLTPPCVFCDTQSAGLHGLDQFAWAMVLGKASNGQCVALDSTKYHHMVAKGNLEAVHDKVIRCQKAMPSKRLVREVTQLIEPGMSCQIPVPQ